MIKHVRSLVGNDNDISGFSILQDGAILFQGTVEGKDGIFYWGQQKQDVQRIISGGEDQEGKWINFYNLSPDQSKILYDMPVQVGDIYKSDIYMAELVEGKIVNHTRIMESVDLYNNISGAGAWSTDSKTAYIKTTSSTDEFVGNIAVFQVTE